MLIAAACAPATSNDVPRGEPTLVAPEPAVSQRVEVVRDSGGAPDACTPRAVGSLVVDFFDAVNREEPEEAVEFFAEDFEWYSITEGNQDRGGRHFAGYDQADLIDYFADRAQQGERMHLLEITVLYEKSRDLGHVTYNLLRTAADIEGYGPDAGGKGAIDCSSGRIFVWSFGQAKRSMFVGELCPGTADPPKVALACTR